jgi:hypothetical protein
MSKPSIVAREAAQVAPKYINEITHHQPTQITAVAPAEEGGWIVEAEVVEVRRVPSSSDILALYEIELDGGGALLGYRRTRRYLRGQALRQDEQETVNGDMTLDGDTSTAVAGPASAARPSCKPATQTEAHPRPRGA